MANEVYKLYQYYQGEELSCLYLYSVLEELLKESPELKPYLNDFDISSKSKDLGNYHFGRRVIKVNLPLIEKCMPKHPQLLAIEVIKHELEHARDLKTLEEGKDDIESLIVQYGLRYFAMRHGLDRLIDFADLDPSFLEKETIANYRINPEERMVAIRGWKYVVNIFKNAKDSDELRIARNRLLKQYQRGYTKKPFYVEAPTLEFLLKTGMFQQYIMLLDRIYDKNYKFDTRLLYGLPITEKEFDTEIQQKVKIKE